MWDAYDENGNKLPEITMERGKQIPNGCYHLVADVIVRHTDGCYLLMQRDSAKHHGGMWEATAGGSALCGENALQCAERELHEETGIMSNGLIELGRVLHRGRQTIYVEYLCHTDIKQDAIRLQAGETVDYKWVSAAQLQKMPKERLISQRILSFID